MIDPITALAGIQSAVALIKKAKSTIDDVSSLGPVLSSFFNAKSNATKAAVQAKNTGNKSNLAIATEIEMALLQAEKIEKEMQMIFMQTGNIDVWNKIKARAQAMDVEAAHEARRTKEAEIRRKRKMKEQLEIAFALVIVTIVAAGVVWGIVELLSYCAVNRCSYK